MAIGDREIVFVQADGSERTLPVGALDVGDCFVVRPGDRFATGQIMNEGCGILETLQNTGYQDARMDQYRVWFHERRRPPRD